MRGAVQKLLLLAAVMLASACAEAGDAPVLQESTETGTPHKTLQRAAGGETIRLAPGYYPPLVLHKKRFSEPVIVDGQGLAIIKRIELDRVQNITFRNIIVEGGPVELQDRDYAVNVMNSAGVSFVGSRIGWSRDGNPLNDAMGVNIRLSENVTLSENIIHDSFIGLVIRDADSVTVKGNIFRDIRRDGINLSGSVDVTLDQNTCTEFHPTRPLDHPDCIQLWNDTADRSNQNIRITGNRVLRGEGGVSQGIFLSGQKPGLPHRDVLIEGNIIHQGMGQGIFIHKTENAIIRNNTTLAAEPVEFLPGLTIRPPVRAVLAEENTVSRLEIRPELLSSGMVMARNNIVRDGRSRKGD